MRAGMRWFCGQNFHPPAIVKNVALTPRPRASVSTLAAANPFARMSPRTA